MNKKKLGLVIVLLALITSYFIFDLGRFFNLDFFKSQQAAIETYRAANPWATAGIFFAVYVTVTALSFPGAAVLTLAAGAIFGLLTGLLIVSFASSIGATLAFLASRFLLRDWVQSRFGDRLKALNAGVKKDGGFYLFTLRLVPALPFFVINLVMGLTPIRTTTFYWVSQIGMLAGTIVYVNAGTQLGQIDSLSGILSPGLIGSFALLGIFPLIAKKIVAAVQAKKVYARWADKKPATFDRNLVVIGGGSAGLVTSYIAAAVKSKVTLIERHKLGGDCLNTGCVPSKALIRSAKFLSHVERAQEFGIDSAEAKMDFAKVMERVQSVVKAIEPHDSVERYTGLGVDVVEGSAKITSPWTVEVTHNDGRIETLTTRAIVIATGARPFVPPIPGIDEMDYLTSDNLWALREQPRRLLVLGGGPIGSELTQAFARLGSQVTQIEMLPRIMAREDEDVSQLVMERFIAEGIDVRVGTKAKQFVIEDGEKVLIAEHEGKDVRIPFDAVLVAVGRAANLTGFGLEEMGIPTGKTVETNEFLQTIYPNIYAAGDVAGPFQFTHTAAHQAWYAAVNALFDPFKTFKADYSVIPWATFVEPEVARVGLNEADARAEGIAYEATKFGIDDLDRAIADSEAHGFVKVLTVPGKDRILGVTIVGEHAGDLIAEYVLAMKHGIGLNKILGTIHIYPTMAEANKYVAGEWKRAHAPQKLLEWVGRFHAWRRA
ncbi:FAD-dependent oxidoreductase [Denitromonas ohlonensis]|uniref:Pyridine nucleotide-disulfide oxidoreductase n=2 Tax=Denitromonas TaxID=139331 RepID=A0A557SID8_9RHOO|nr:bifunctional TVP38/TMEM64 family protein/FAD-dependent oxidoreductase [Denitromonas ohlonensis]TVO69095.1 pyridine nucleotide-disulfide oxidoreductase [Denitromonas ohlonensis]TVO77195.1 pyridine nucleotide-disulfide oxidoreductase [Denitromonas ohlonensis]